MGEAPVFAWVVLAILVGIVAVRGWRGFSVIRDALQELELDRLAPPPHWPATRALLGVLLALPGIFATRALGYLPWLLGSLLVVVGYAAAPSLLSGTRRRLERQLLDDLALHLDLIAVALESGGSWSAALSLCIERTPPGPLRRAWSRMLVDMRAGAEPLDALRALEQRLRLQPFATLVSALRAAEKLKLPAAGVLRERARHCAAARFARAERQARAVPLKLWAALVLCLAPCTAVVLAYPLASLLGRVMA